MPVLGEDSEDRKVAPIQFAIDHNAIDDEDEDAPQITQADLLRAKVGMCSECHPFDEKILTAQHGYIAIADLDVNKHRLIVYNQEKNRIAPGGNGKTRTGYQISEIHKREYTGSLIHISTQNGMTRVTPNHILSVRWNERALEGLWATYLMRKGKDWRLGKVGAFGKSNTRRHTNGIKNRLYKEGADELWILGLYSNPKEALFYEQLWQAEFGLPGLIFKPSTYPVHSNNNDEDVVRFYNMIETEPRAITLLREFGLDPAMPFYHREYTKKYNPTTGFHIRAVNLFEEYMEIPTYNDHWKPEWISFTKSQSHYEGLVYNLEVPYHHYIANGVIVHNCKSVIPDDQVENNVFYQQGQPMSCPFCGGVVAIVPEAIASTEYFHNRLDQLRGIGMTGYIPGVTAE